MRAITIYQPWASLIAYEAKPYEFRKWAPSQRHINQRIAIHASKRSARRDEILHLIDRLEQDGAEGTGLVPEASLELLNRAVVAPGSLPTSAVVCTAFLGRARKCTDLFGGQVADSDRIDQHKWAWPLTNVVRLEPPIPARGAQGFWNWTDSAADQVTQVPA